MVTLYKITQSFGLWKLCLAKSSTAVAIQCDSYHSIDFIIKLHLELQMKNCFGSPLFAALVKLKMHKFSFYAAHEFQPAANFLVVIHVFN